MPVTQRRQQLREALIAAAERRIAERGLAGLKARDLAQDVGCALGTIYTAFPDLDALILAVNARTLDLLDRALGAPGPAGRDPVEALVALASGYLEFAALHRLRWRALFDHRMPEGQAVPDWYIDDQTRLFSYVEAPLHAIRPELTDDERALLARSLFSAVHGIVSLGLEEKLVAVPMPQLREQTAFLVSSMARGMTADPGQGR